MPMEFDTTIELEIREQVNSGVLPTVVFRRLLTNYPHIKHYDLGSHFGVAFPDTDSVVWDLVALWRPSNEHEVLDMRVNIGLIEQLIESGYPMKWDRAWLELQWQRIKSIVLAPPEQTVSSINNDSKV